MRWAGRCFGWGNSPAGVLSSDVAVERDVEVSWVPKFTRGRFAQ